MKRVEGTYLLKRYERLNAERWPVDGGYVGQVYGWVVVGGVGGPRGVDSLVGRVANWGNLRAG